MRWLIALALVAAGCASSSGRIEATLQPWVGQRIEALVARQGAPASVFELPDGTRTYTWWFEGATRAMATNFAVARTTVAKASTDVCRLDWTTDAQGVLRGYHWEGACRAR